MVRPIQIKSEVIGVGDGSRREFSLRHPPHPGTVSVRIGEGYKWTELIGTWADNADFRWDTLKSSYPEVNFVAIATGAIVFATPPAAGMLILADYTVAVPDPEEYQVRILDRYRQVRAVLPGIRWQYSRRINEATEINVYIPRAVVDEHIPAGHSLRGYFSHNKARYAEIASYIQILRGNELKVSGRINSRTLGELITIQAYTEEILLESNLTPAQYGMVWDGWDLADVARDLLDDWQSIRVKDQSQWQSYMVASSNIDLGTDPGHAMLAKRSNGRYYDSGYIVLAFSAGEIEHFKRWDRIRWSADSEDPVKTTIQYSTDGSNWSTEFDGGLPENIGVVPDWTDEPTVYVRLNLYTEDTESEDADENPVGVTPVAFAVEVVARTTGELTEGIIPAVAGVTVKGLDADHASAFQVLLAACEQAGWEFEVANGALNISEALGVNRTGEFVLRASTNMEITTLGDDDEEICNILTAYGPGQGINRLEVTLRDQASIALYGPYPQAVEFEAESLAELQTKAQEYLEAHSEPTTQFEVFVEFDEHREPEYGLGDIVRVADPDTGIITKSRIMAETREYGENGLSVHLELGKAGLSLQSVLEQEPGAKPVDPLQPTGVYARSIVTGLVAGCAVPKGDWGYTECHISPIANFVPSTGTMRARGRQTHFEITTGLEVGRRYYVRLIHVDSAGRRSVASVELSAIAGRLPQGAIEVGPVNAPQWGVCQFITDISLSWQIMPGAMAYEIRTSNDNWGQDTGLVYRGNAQSYSFLPTQRNYTFYIKAINAAGVYSEDVSSKSLSLDPPLAPSQPEVIEFFRMLKIKIVPLNNPAVLGYYVYLTESGENTPVVETLRAGESLSYPADSGTAFSIQVAAFDVLGSGAKSEPLVATTTFLGEPDIPEGIVGETKLSRALATKIDDASTTATDAQARVGAVETAIDNAETRLTGVEGRVTTAESDITNLNGQIVLKASQADLNAVEGRVTDTEASLTVQAGQIASKADQTSVDAIDGRVTTAESTLTQHATAISSKVAQTDFDAMGNVVSDTVSKVEQHGDQYAVRVQTRADGKEILSGFGLLNDPTSGTSEFGIMVDNFRIFAAPDDDPDDPGTAVLAFDTQTREFYLLGNLTAAGLIRAPEVQAEVIKTLLLKAELAYVDEADVIKLRADKITVGGKPHGMAIAMPQGAQLFHFDGTLMSTQGLEPTTATASIADGGGKFGGAAVVTGQLKYPVTGGTVAVQRDETTWNDYSSMTWTQLNAM